MWIENKPDPLSIHWAVPWDDDYKEKIRNIMRLNEYVLLQICDYLEISKPVFTEGNRRKYIAKLDKFLEKHVDKIVDLLSENYSFCDRLGLGKILSFKDYKERMKIYVLDEWSCKVFKFDGFVDKGFLIPFEQKRSFSLVDIREENKDLLFERICEAMYHEYLNLVAWDRYDLFKFCCVGEKGGNK